MQNKSMNEDYLSYRWRNKDKPFLFDDTMNVNQIYNEVRTKFYDSISYKWNLQKCVDYVQSKEKLKPDEFIQYLEEIF